MSTVPLPRLSLLGLLCAATAGAAMRDALTAAQLLAGLVDTHLVRLELPVGPGHAEPRKIHGVVVDFDGVLWLYTPGLGTRPLGPAPRDDRRTSTEISARLRRLEPALGRVEVFARPLLPAAPLPADSLRNACFAGCLHHLAELFASGETVDDAGVLFLSGEAGTAAARGAGALGEVGHTLLAYRSGSRWRALDPAVAAAPFVIGSPQVDAAIDPALAAHARRARYPLGRAQFHRFSAAALARLAAEVEWRARRPLSAPDRDR